jgi:catechol 2,3-dioxygenase-like lactoylglutathione lyase family enzyme
MERRRQRGLLSRRDTLTLLGAVAATRGANAAEPGILQPATLDHVNLRVSNVAKSAEFYTALFDTPLLRNPALRARPNLPPGEAIFLKMGEGYLVISTAFAPDIPGLDHYSVGIRNYEQGKLATKLNDSGIVAEARSADVWVRDPDGTFIQLRTTGGWARQSAAPMQRPNGGPSLSPLVMSRIVIRSADLGRGGDFYGRLYGTEVASAATSSSRTFELGDSTLELISTSANSSSANSSPGIDRMRIAIKDFNAETVGRALRERGIAIAGSGADHVRVTGPDGIGIELTATGS